MRRLILPLLIAALVAAACSEAQERVTIGSYYDSYAEITGNLEDRAGALNDVLSVAEPTSVDAQAWDEAADQMRDYADDLDSLTPPDELEEEHGAHVDALRQLVTAFERLIDGEDVELETVASRALETCAVLEELAYAHGIDFPQRCGDAVD